MQVTDSASVLKQVQEAPVNTSKTKQSHAFSKAARFSSLNLNDRGLATSILHGTSATHLTTTNMNKSKAQLPNSLPGSLNVSEKLVSDSPHSLRPATLTVTLNRK